MVRSGENTHNDAFHFHRNLYFRSARRRLRFGVHFGRRCAVPLRGARRSDSLDGSCWLCGNLVKWQGRGSFLSIFAFIILSSKPRLSRQRVIKVKWPLRRQGCPKRRDRNVSQVYALVQQQTSLEIHCAFRRARCIPEGVFPLVLRGRRGWRCGFQRLESRRVQECGFFCSQSCFLCCGSGCC